MRKWMIVASALLAMALATVPALAQGLTQEEPPETGSDDGPTDLGTITNISGDTILVEEDPTVSLFEASPLVPGGDKGYYTVTGETGILRLRGDELVPASFDDLEVGQSVTATYQGGIAAVSYPSQGFAGTIVILDDPDGGDVSFIQYDNAG